MYFLKWHQKENLFKTLYKLNNTKQRLEVDIIFKRQTVILLKHNNEGNETTDLATG